MANLLPESQLIPLYSHQVGDERIETVDGREFHAFLENSAQFSDWIRDRIRQYGFQENQDFVTFSELSEKGRPRRDYALTLDMAKELAMVERNDKGKAARQYFIQCERHLKALPPPAQLPPRTTEQDLALIDQSLTLLDRLQLLEPRDRLFFADRVREVSRRALLPPTLPGTATPLPLPPPAGASVADRLYVLAPTLTPTARRTLNIEGGKRCAKEYRARYPGRTPEPFTQYIDGAARPVNGFPPQDLDWVDAILQTLLAQWHSTHHAQESPHA